MYHLSLPQVANEICSTNSWKWFDNFFFVFCTVSFIFKASQLDQLENVLCFHTHANFSFYCEGQGGWLKIPCFDLRSLGLKYWYVSIALGMASHFSKHFFCKNRYNIYWCCYLWVINKKGSNCWDQEPPETWTVGI